MPGHISRAKTALLYLIVHSWFRSIQWILEKNMFRVKKNQGWFGREILFKNFTWSRGVIAY